MANGGNWSAGYTHAVENDREPVWYTQYYIDPEAVLVVGFALAGLCAFGLMSGRSVYMKFGPLMLNII